MASSNKPGITALNPADIARVKIFPPIGIARVGDSGFDNETGEPDLDSIEYFLPPEVPGIYEVEHGKFREDPRKRKDRVARQVQARLLKLAQEHGLDLNNTDDLEIPCVNGKTLNQIKEELTHLLDDHHDRIRRQAVRFRVYAYNKDGKNLGEITTQGGYRLSWNVHVANHKAAWRMFRGILEEQALGVAGLRNPEVQGDRTSNPQTRDRLVVDPGPRAISSQDLNTSVNISGTFRGSRRTSVNVHLGQLRTNNHGHLIFIGGAGYAQCVSDYNVPHADIVSGFDNANWIDDTCDGWVTAVVDHDAFEAKLESSKATVLSAPPKFAWAVRAPTTLYDIIENIYAKQPERWVDSEGEASFYRHIWPVLHSAHALSWTNKDAFIGHGISGKGNFMDLEEKLKHQGPESKVFRRAVFNRLRAPDYKVLTQATTQYMPRLSGNNGEAIEPGTNFPNYYTDPPIQAFAALTAVQYERFSQWKDGKFHTNPDPWKGKKTIEDVDLKYQPLCLTLAALEQTIGNPLYPGIEVPWVILTPGTLTQNVDTNNDRIDPPFRINHDTILPGYLTRGLSLPWQSDFDNCHTNWWPSNRPDDVINERFFQKSEVSEEEFIATVLPNRLPWSRGLRVSSDYALQYYPGSTDMVKYWPRLGFVVKHSNKIVKRRNGKGNDPAWLETEREKIVQKETKTRLPFENLIAVE